MTQTRTTLYDVQNAFYGFRRAAADAGLTANMTMWLNEGRPRWGTDFTVECRFQNEDGAFYVDTPPAWVPTDLTASRGVARQRLLEAANKINAKVATRNETLDEAATLLLDEVGLLTYKTFHAEGMTKVEALRSAVLLSRD